MDDVWWETNRFQEGASDKLYHLETDWSRYNTWMRENNLWRSVYDCPMYNGNRMKLRHGLLKRSKQQYDLHLFRGDWNILRSMTVLLKHPFYAPGSFFWEKGGKEI